MRRRLLLPCLAASLAGCAGSALPAPPSTRAASPAPGAHPHVMMVVMENHSIDQVIGTGQAPYIDSLAAHYGLATDWSDVGHPSLPNYLAYASGSAWGNPADTTPQDATYAGPSLVDELARAGFTWKAYMEDMPRACDLDDTFGPGHYDVNHNPFLYFDTVRADPAQCARDVPYAAMGTDLAAGTLPDFAWVSPNTEHDMHDGTVQQGDAWLHGMLPAVLGSAWYRDNGVVIVTWDEGESSEQVATIVISPHTTAGARLTSHGTEYGTLRTVEMLYGIAFLGASADAANGDLRPLLR